MSSFERFLSLWVLAAILAGLALGQMLPALFSALAGIIWYGQFFFYGMGTTKMGRFDFSSWSIHMAFIIVFSNLWGIAFHEWRLESFRLPLGPFFLGGELNGLLQL